MYTDEQAGQVLRWLRSKEAASLPFVTPQAIADKIPGLSVAQARTILRNVLRLSRGTEQIPKGILIPRPTSAFDHNFEIEAEQKEAIAAIAAEKIIASDTSVFAGPGTTVAFTITRLKEKKRLCQPVITDSAAVIEIIGGHCASLVILEGEYHPTTHAFFGIAPFVSKIRFGISIIGVSGIDEKGILYTFTQEEACFIKRMLELTDQVLYVVAAITKLSSCCMYQIASIGELQKRLRVVVITNPLVDFPAEDKLQERAEATMKALEKMECMILAEPIVA